MFCTGLLLGASFACATAGPPVPYVNTAGYHAIGTSIYGYLERDLDGDGLVDVVLARRDAKGYRLSVMERGDPSGNTWKELCSTEPVKGDDMVRLGWLGEPGKDLAMLVVGEENPEESVQRFVVADPHHDCAVAWADMLTVPQRETPVMRSSASPPEGLSWNVGNTLRIIDRSEVVGLQAKEGPVGVLARYRERTGTVTDGHLVVQENTRAVLRRRAANVVWHTAEAPVAVPELTDGEASTAFVVRPGESGTLTIESPELMVLVELHHGCEVGDDAPLSLSHSGQTYVTGTAPTEHAPFRAAGRRHPRDASYTQELLALRDPVNHVTFDLAPGDTMRCLREVMVYGW